MYSIKFLHSGFDVYACTNADSALKAIRNGYKPDVILFDITMPEKTGYEFLQELATIPLSNHCLKIALTNESQDGTVERVRELGASAYFIKAQYTPAEVVKAVQDLLAQQDTRSSHA